MEPNDNRQGLTHLLIALESHSTQYLADALTFARI